MPQSVILPLLQSANREVILYRAVQMRGQIWTFADFVSLSCHVKVKMLS